MVTKMWEFKHKISYNSAHITVMANNLALNRDFSGSRYLTSSLEF